MQPTQAMDEVLTALAGQDDELDELIGGLDESGWARPSRCPDWSISDVVLHLAQTNEMTAASAERRLTEAAAAFGNPAGAKPAATVDDLAGLAVAAARGRPGRPGAPCPMPSPEPAGPWRGRWPWRSRHPTGPYGSSGRTGRRPPPSPARHSTSASWPPAGSPRRPRPSRPAAATATRSSSWCAPSPEASGILAW